MVGGDPAIQLAGKKATADIIESLRAEMGLNKSLIEQYFDFLKQTYSLLKKKQNL